MENTEVFQKELNDLYKLRGDDTLKIFNQVIYSEIENPKLLTILKDVTMIWKDRYRPTLTSLSCEAVGGKPEDTSTVNLMIAFGGAGIGIHDDIIDKSMNKRFKKTILGLHGIEGTLLAGDVLIVKGLAAIQEIIKEGIQPHKVVEIINVLKRHYFEICEGVFLESVWRQNIDIKLGFCHDVLWKYGSDGEACTRLGAIVGNGTKKEVEALGDYGRLLCYVFRLGQEVKDVFRLEGDLIRRLKHESVPIPILYAAKTSKKNTSLLNSLLKGPIASPDIKERTRAHKILLALCFETDAFKYVNNIAQKKVCQGKKILNALKPSRARDFLTLMIQNVLDFTVLCE